MPPAKWLLNPSEMARIRRKIKIENDCWIWTGPKTPNGYGKHRVGPGKPDRVIHRIVWEHYKNQQIPEKLQLDHLCRNRLCCNPDHFEVVTGSENTMRQEHANRLKTECPKGHEYTEETTRITPAGKRVCKTCDRMRKQGNELHVTGFPSLDITSPKQIGVPPLPEG